MKVIWPLKTKIERIKNLNFHWVSFFDFILDIYLHNYFKREVNEFIFFVTLRKSQVSSRSSERQWVSLFSWLIFSSCNLLDREWLKDFSRRSFVLKTLNSYHQTAKKATFAFLFSFPFRSKSDKSVYDINIFSVTSDLHIHVIWLTFSDVI